MKPVLTLLKPVALLLITGLLTGGDCSDRENVGYHSFTIPGYSYNDYYQMLFSSNEEILYNAVCNLTNIAKPELLETDSLKESVEYPLALKIYEKIYLLMDVKNTWVSSAAIRYTGQFNYNRKSWLEHCLSNSSSSVNVQLAIWASWRNKEDDTAATTALLIQKANFCLQHPSWLIQQAAYDYITSATAPYFEQAFIKSYNTTSEQYKKLKIIEALNTHLCDTVFNFFTAAYAATTDTLLQDFLLQALPNAINGEHALQWFQSHQKETFQLLKNHFAFSGKGQDIYRSLVLQALKQGWDPSGKVYYTDGREQYPLLYYSLFEDKYHYEGADSSRPPQSAIGALIEQQLLADKKLAPGWVEYEQKHLLYPLPATLIREQQQLTAAYTAATKQLFEQYKLDSSASKNFLVQLDNITRELYRSKQHRP